MAKALSIPIAIPSILVLLSGGYGVIQVSNVGAYIIWGIAFIWFLGLVLYLPQRIIIDIDKCFFAIGSTPQNLLIVVEGFISARHPITLVGFDICLLGWRIGPLDGMASALNSIDSRGQAFHVVFPMSVDALEEGRMVQEKGKAVDIGKIHVCTRRGCWISEAFAIPGDAKMFHKGGWLNNMKKKFIPTTKRQKSEIGITRKELRDLLNKASQPIKKFEKEKSQS